MEQLKGSIVKENDIIFGDNSQSKINHDNNLNILNAKKSDTKVNNYLTNEIKNESEKCISNNSNIKKNRYYNHDSKNYKYQDFSGIFNKLMYKNDDNSGQKFKLNDGQKKIGLILSNKKLTFDTTGKFDTKIKNKKNILNNNINASILKYKFCGFFSICKKSNKNNENPLENSLNYLTKSFDIFTYLKTIKNQEILINALFDQNNCEIFKKLESLHFNSNNIFDNDNIYLINKGKRRKSSVNDVDNFWDLFIQLLNKTSKTQAEQRLTELIFNEINAV